MSLEPTQRFDPDSLTGRDPAFIRRVLPLVRAFNQHYLHAQRSGLENLPDGPALLAANHNGGIAGPDLSCTLETLWERRGVEAPVYALAHDFAMLHFRRLGKQVQRLGGLRASPDNARRALAAGAHVLVYPGGDLDAYRHFRCRNEVRLGERLGFVRVAQETGVPIVPVVAHGAHRSAYIFHEGEALARWMRLHHWGRLSRFPLALALPWGFAPGPWIPYLPLPFRIRLHVLPPLYVGPHDDPGQVCETVRRAMQGALDRMSQEAA